MIRLRRIKPSEMDALYGIKKNGRIVSSPCAVICRFPKNSKNIELIFTKKTTPFTLAHEIGHIALHHLYNFSFSPRVLANQEIEAWLWAMKKTGKHSSRKIFMDVVFCLFSAFPDMHRGKVFQIVNDSLKKYGLKEEKLETIGGYLLKRSSERRTYEC